jgi:SAM-dependent methyltransferase
MTERSNNPHTATAFEAWDRRWLSETGRADWLEPEPEVRNVLALLHERSARNVLDLGCGVGRHSIFLSLQGFAVSATDASAAALDYTGKQARLAGTPVGLQYAEMTSLPFEDAHFDYVLAWNVIYHGNPGVVEAAIREIRRVLKPGGILQATMLSKRDSYFGIGEEIAPDTFVLSCEDEEKSHAHYYCDLAGLHQLYRGFCIMKNEEREQKRPGSFHWTFTAQLI